MNSNCDAILDEWKSFIKLSLLPKIEEIGEILEGNIYSLNLTTDYYDPFKNKQLNILYASQQLNPGSHVLEIGFNSGFSALLMLLANPFISVTCVDIASHQYTLPCFNILKNVFHDRIHLVTGDSREEVPKLINTFDLIHIDGAHSNEIAEMDIQNSIAHANNQCILIFDDIDIQDLNRLWSLYVEKYNMRDVSFKTEAQEFHSLKQYFF